ncbi:MAG: OmpH family outer membrane protein [Mucilaginibacter sp.]
MKKAPVITTLSLGLMVAVGMTACNQNKTATAPATSSSAATTPDHEAIVYVNSDSLLSKYNYVKDVNKKLNDKGSAAKAEVQSRRDALQRELAEYQKNASTMPADQRQTTEQRLQREGQAEQAYEQNTSAEIQDEQAKATGKLDDKIAEYVKQYAKEKGYKMVLTYSKNGSSVIYGDPSLDITADIVKGLNDAYAKDGDKDK